MSTPSITGTVEQYYIVAPAIPRPERTLVLKQDQTFGIFNEFGDIDTQARQDEGLYHEGTRFLSNCTLSLAGGRPLLLSAAVRRDNLVLGSDLTNPDLYSNGHVAIERGSIHIFRAKLIWNGVCYERIHVRNFSPSRLQTTLKFQFAADYADIFEVRGQPRAARGQLLEPLLGSSGVQMQYQGLDDVLRATRIHCQQFRNLSGCRLGSTRRATRVHYGCVLGRQASLAGHLLRGRKSASRARRHGSLCLTN
jgi:glycogen debranching enzyme